MTTSEGEATRGAGDGTSAGATTDEATNQDRTTGTAPATGGGPRVGDVQTEADRLIKALQAERGVDEAVYAVAVLANRAAAELHRLTKGEATARKGTPEWGAWAALQNSARKLVLDATSARDGAARLVGRQR